jgi:hypothetical protein
VPASRKTASILKELVSETCPSGFTAFESERLEKLQLAARLVLKGHSIATALALADGPRGIATWFRLIYCYKQSGILGLRSNYKNCGRSRRFSPQTLRLVAAHLALKAALQELTKRINVERRIFDCPKIKGAAESVLRRGGLAGISDSSFAEIVLDSVLNQRPWQFPKDLQPVAEEITELAAKALFPEEEDVP